jgi:hypothetical protein
VFIILKNHLLIEELLTDLFKENLKRDNLLTIEISKNTMFAQKLNLCCALIGKDIKFEIWPFLKELNSIRDKMAYSLEPKGIDKRIESFTNIVSEYEHYMMLKQEVMT